MFGGKILRMNVTKMNEHSNVATFVHALMCTGYDYLISHSSKSVTLLSDGLTNILLKCFIKPLMPAEGKTKVIAG